MKSYKKLPILLLTIALAATGCLKDELTEGELGDGTIEIKPEIEPEIEPDPKCSRKTLRIDVDSVINLVFFPFVDGEFCECDTVDIVLTNIPNSVAVIGFVSEEDTIPNFKTKMTGITEPWFGQLVLLDQFIDFSFPIRVDFDECP